MTEYPRNLNTSHNISFQKKEFNYHLEWLHFKKIIKSLPEHKTIREVLKVFTFFHFHKGKVFPSQKKVAFLIQKSERTVRNAIYRLEKLNLISRGKRSYLKTRIYEINFTQLKNPASSKIYFSPQNILEEYKTRSSTKVSGEVAVNLNYPIIYKSISLYEKLSQESVLKNKFTRKIENKENVDFSQETKRLITEAKTIWEEEVEGKISFPKLTSYFIKRFLTSFQKLFKNSLDKFREYCRKIASSRFLMGEKNKFQAWFSWLIKLETYERIFSGEFDIGDRVPLKIRQEYQKNAEDQKERELKKQCRERTVYETTIEVRRERNQKLLEAEESMTKEEKESLKDSFEKLLMAGKHSLSKFFKETGWNTPFIDIMFNDYKKEIILKINEEEHIQKKLEQYYSHFNSLKQDILLVNF